MRIVFLHIPKTAGQSVHAALVKAFGEDVVCPARVNEQLARMTITELNRYQVFSGHLDWAMLDCIKGPKYVFTILRNPVDRILSFYFYLRDQAANLPVEKLHKPEHQGLRAALELTPQEYFSGGPGHLRKFLDDHYDNFYAYYFASRHFQGRAQLHGLMKRGELNQEDVLRMAKDNLGMLDDVFTIDNMTDVFATIRRLSDSREGQVEEYQVNVNKNLSADNRVEKLRLLGGDDKLLKRIDHYCELDNKIWDLYS
jgi:hypothetical protein